ncbi:MAG: hypothetical protein IT361_18440 [Gemmatimonadaceae bacterium]|nr:hypothetical protein [Gemmatimonadaceae bacterium]
MNEHRIVVERRARFYSVGDLTTASDVWVVLHGYGQLAREFLATFTPLVAAGRAFVAPEALNRFYLTSGASGSHQDAAVGATWMTREDREAEIADAVAYLDAVTNATRAPRARLCTLAFSQGVATMIRWLALGAARAERVVVWAGRFPHDLDVRDLAPRLPANGIELVSGTRDAYGGWAALEEQEAQLNAAGVPVRRFGFEGGHRLDDATLRAIVDR